jgi:hypothetical protein
MLVYTNLSDMFLAKSDGTESRRLISVKGDIKHVTWSPDSSHLRFDTTESAGGLGQQLAWGVSAAGTDLHRLFAGWHNPPDECCGKWTAVGSTSYSNRTVKSGRFREKPAFFTSNRSPLH